MNNKTILLECPPVGVNRITNVYKTIDDWQRSQALHKLVENFGSKIPDNLSTTDRAAWLLHFSERWDFRKLQKEAQANDISEGARWLINDSSLTNLQQSIIKESARMLGLIGIEKPNKNYYDFVVILGGARLSCLLRPRHAANIIKKHLIKKVKAVILLSSLRPIAESERDATNTYAPNTVSEFDLINKGAEKAFNITEVFTEQRYDDKKNPNNSWVVRKYKNATNRLPIVSISAPSSEPDKRRANSADTYEFFFKNVTVPTGSSLLLITSQIYVPYQQLEAIRTIAIPHKVTVDTIGFPVNWGGSLQKMSALSNYLQEIRSTIQSANRFFDAYPKR